MRQQMRDRIRGILGIVYLGAAVVALVMGADVIETKWTEVRTASVAPRATPTPQDDSRVSCEQIEREAGQEVCPVVSGDGLLRCRGEDSTPEFGEAACYLDGGFDRCGWKMLVMPDGTPWYLKWTDPRTQDEGGFCS